LSRDAITRRNALAGAATLGVAVPLLAACGGDGSSATDPANGSSPDSGAELGPTSDIPVGGGKVFADESVVVTQPTDGEFKCFSAACTHQGCLVSNVEEGSINCTCHGSRFSITDGSVEGGPAPSALPSVGINVDGGSITLA
jgi:Rieske Fe-S protein